ncbi:hypothetical protein JOQ06_000937 [Pogonophryne albipinna]|uniref:Uncharacterized protein n=1 Tax=Pogonophryne albipinna TaxID=1090488 RepID=A0AAD6FJH6_9TELE|nr:hypothetical protein JOQ06_000937 [Pogonophryne albipinna]
MPHQSFRGLKQVPVPKQCYGRHVSQVLETDDVRPLIGCLQWRRHQPAAQADGTESRTRGNGRMAGVTGEGGGEGDKVGQGGGVAEECQGREVGVMEKVSR